EHAGQSETGECPLCKAPLLVGGVPVAQLMEAQLEVWGSACLTIAVELFIVRWLATHALLIASRSNRRSPDDQPPSSSLPSIELSDHPRATSFSQLSEGPAAAPSHDVGADLLSPGGEGLVGSDGLWGSSRSSEASHAGMELAGIELVEQPTPRHDHLDHP
ncbi:MAG: hypothetical protein SGPRY_013472, partial [Prymnesium sp.]